MVWWSSRILSAPAPGVSVLWEDFETGNRLTSFNPSSSNWGTASEAGDTVLKYTGGVGHSMTWDDDDVYSASDNIYIEAFLRADGTGTNLTSLVFGKQTGANNNGYQVIIDMRNGTGSSAGFHIRENLGFSPVLANDDSVTVTNGVWYRVQVDWVASGTRITARLYDDSDTLLSTLTSSDSTYTSGRIGVHSYNPGSFNDIDVWIGDPPPTPTPTPPPPTPTPTAAPPTVAPPASPVPSPGGGKASEGPGFFMP